MYAAALALLFVSFGAVAWRNFRLALILLFGLLPSYLLRFSVGPIPSTALEVFILTLAVIWFLRNWRDVRFASVAPFRIPLLLTFGAACLAAAFAPDIWSALGLLKAYYVEPALVLFMACTTLTSRNDWQRVFAAFAWSVIAVSILGIIQYFTRLGLPMPWLLERRITSVFDFPNAVGLFLAPIVSLLMVQILNTQGRQRVIYITGIILSAVAILLAKTEAALIAVPAALGLTLLISKAQLRTKVVVTMAAVALGVSAFAAVPEVRDKILLRDISGQARRLTWSESVELLTDHPLIGAGLSGFPTAIAPYHDGTYFEIFQYPHNLILNIWVELGILGIIAFFAWCIASGKIIVRNRSDLTALSITAALLTMVIHGLVDVPFFKNDLAVLTAGLFAGLLASQTKTTRH